MKTILSIILFLSAFGAFGQKAKIEDSKEAVLTDSVTKCYYVLDTAHLHITAYDSTDKKLWVFSTYVSSFGSTSSLVEIGVMELCGLTAYYLTKGHLMGETVLKISHTNCEGVIYLDSGQYGPMVCD